MSDINLDAAVEIAKQRATLYANRKKGSGDPAIWSVIYNSHLDGLLECLGERESLRAIVSRLESDYRKVLEVAVESAPLKPISDPYSVMVAQTIQDEEDGDLL